MLRFEHRADTEGHSAFRFKMSGVKKIGVETDLLQKSTSYHSFNLFNIF